MTSDDLRPWRRARLTPKLREALEMGAAYLAADAQQMQDDPTQFRKMRQLEATIAFLRSAALSGSGPTP